MQARLEAENIPYDTGCATASGYVLLGLEARFLDPETYQGFPVASYTYVTTAQVGSFVPTRTPIPRYPKDVTRARRAKSFRRGPPMCWWHASSLSVRRRSVYLARAWSEANIVAFGSYLRFAALGLALAVLRALPVSFRGVKGRSSSPHPPK